jgi:hypothetical protein
MLGELRAHVAPGYPQPDDVQGPRRGGVVLARVRCAFERVAIVAPESAGNDDNE